MNPQAISIIASIVALLISSISLGVALSQYRLARLKLRLDLFERRWKLYMTARDLLHESTKATDADDDCYKRSVENLETAAFLLPPEALAVIGQINNLSSEADTYRRLYPVNPDGDAQAMVKLTDHRKELHLAKNDVMNRLGYVFTPLLDFRKL